MKKFDIKYHNTKWIVNARGFKDAAKKFYNLIGGEKWFMKHHLAALCPTFKTMSGIYKVEKEIWIWADGKNINI